MMGMLRLQRYVAALIIALTALMGVVGCGYSDSGERMPGDSDSDEWIPGDFVSPSATSPALPATPIPAADAALASQADWMPLPTHAPLPRYTPAPVADAGGGISVSGDDSSAPTPLAVLPQLSPTPTAIPTVVPTATATLVPVEATAVAGRVASNNRQRCNAWAISNMSPIAYAEFRLLDPDAMDDGEKAQWRQIILYGNYDPQRDYSENEVFIAVNQASGRYLGLRVCADYWSVRL